VLFYTIKRILQVIPVIIIISIVVFLLVHLIPGDPVRAMLGLDVDQEVVEAYRETLGLNDPLHIQYFRYISGVIKGDLGTSIYTKNSVWSEIQTRYPFTFKLALLATVSSGFIGAVIGIIAAVWHNKFIDNFLIFISLLSISTPAYFIGLLLMLFFSLRLGLLPSIGLTSPLHYILPVITLSGNSIGLIARTTRSAMLDVLGQDYIRTSKSRGIANSKILFVHALKNALIPVVTVIGLRFGGLLAGATLTETVFSIPGMGRFLVNSVLNRDYPAIQGCVLILAVTFIVINTIIDLLYSWIDPRVKYV